MWNCLGTCHGHLVGAASTGSTLYVLDGRTLCFTCENCHNPDIMWTVTSFDGGMWSGLTGARLQSSQNGIDQGVVYANGTLLITNSSSLFSKKEPGSISFYEKNGANSSSKYNVLLGGNLY